MRSNYQPRVSNHMPPSLAHLHQPQKIIVVIRSAGERTVEACKASVLKQVRKECLYVVQECPFEAALQKTYEIGLESNADWLMTLDADVFLREDAVSKLLLEAEKLPAHYFHIEGLVHDKLTGMYRKAGHRLYRTKYLQTARQLIPRDGSEIRPEYAILQRMETKGFPSLEINAVFGIHDYEQFLRDIYRKAFVHAHKHPNWLPQLFTRFKHLANKQDDFRIALRGLYDGLLSFDEVKIDTRDFVGAADNALEELGLQEKEPMSIEEYDSRWVEEILAETGELPCSQDSNSLNAKLVRLKSRYDRLGTLRIVPYFFGAMLCDVGATIKRLVEKGR